MRAETAMPWHAAEHRAASSLPRRVPGAALVAALDDMTAREASRIVKCLGLPNALFDLAPPVPLPSGVPG